MTRKDYILISRSIATISKMYAKEVENPSNTSEEKAFFLGGNRAIQLIVNSLASELSIQNSQFDGAKFLEACGSIEKDPMFLIFSKSN